MNKIKILYLIDEIDSAYGGTELQLVETIRRLDRTRFEPILICLKKTPWCEREGLKLGCKIVVLEYEGMLKWSFTSVIARLRRTLVDENPSILQTFFEETIPIAYLATRFMPNRPLLLSSRRDIGLNQESWQLKFLKSIIPLIYRSFNGIVVNGKNIKEHVINDYKVNESRIQVIFNGIDTTLNPSPAPEIFSSRRAKVWICFTANLNPVKRIDVFLRALRHIKDDYKVPDFRALLLGDGPERDSLVQLAKELNLDDIVQFMGSVRNPSAYLQHSDLGVLCSDKEGFSNAIMEYLAHSLPVVATAVGGNTELVDATNGFCVPKADARALAEGIAKLCSDPGLRKRLGKAGREKLESQFNWSKTMESLQCYYEDLMKSRAGK